MYENIIVHAVSSLFAPCFSAVKLVCLQYFFIGVHLNDTHTFLHPVRQLPYFSLSVDTVLWVATIMQAAFCAQGLRLQAPFACSFPLALFSSLRTISLRLMQILIIFPTPECREQKLVICEKSCALCRGWQIFLHLMKYAEIMKAACLCRPLFVCEVCVCRLLLHAHLRLHFFSHCEQFSCALCRCW